MQEYLFRSPVCRLNASPIMSAVDWRHGDSLTGDTVTADKVGRVNWALTYLVLWVYLWGLHVSCVSLSLILEVLCMVRTPSSFASFHFPLHARFSILRHARLSILGNPAFLTCVLGIIVCMVVYQNA